MAVTAVAALGADPKIIHEISRASARTGVDFDYLLATARRESGFDSQAESKTSSAAGLFQFVKQTWLATLDRYGAGHGFGAYAEAITRDQQGRYTIAEPALETEILALRFDPAAAAAMAAELAKENAKSLRAELGRVPDAGELYAAHVLGVSGAGRLLELAETMPDSAADTHFPTAAAANRGLFYDGKGQALTLAGLRDRLTGAGGNTAPHSGTHAVQIATRVSDPASCGIDPLGGSSGLGAPGGVGAMFGYGHPPLRLTPEVLAVLNTLDPALLDENNAKRDRAAG